MFRVGKTVEIEFKPEDYDKAVKWMLDTIAMIYQDEKFFDKIKLDYAKRGKKLKEFR